VRGLRVRRGRFAREGLHGAREARPHSRENPRFVLGKVGFFVLEDEMTRANMNFTNDVLL
jgi:hypothetical protein